MLNVVLVEPEIPQNTGNIVRTCAATECKLHLVKPLGFSVEDKYLKRAGLDYWHMVDIKYYNSFEDLINTYPTSNFYLATTKARKRHSDVNYQAGDFIVFGKETKGLSLEILTGREEKWIRIPMLNDARSLNLANSAAVVIYEGLRQLDYPQLR
ncbi:MAG: tRNA (uridine(34)/cytosine(34)/5-carboxymethylaminomethyluridine(34)-2'-O)-methyltransferase TrmL [Bacillota bacterium]|nr:tRNA (uridine(34)/cytosine(34)/5-carboxymethylaminomethyluridine(34)-2'-O)-methyltransferase TrmL [Bacillota bacterium]